MLVQQWLMADHTRMCSGSVGIPRQCEHLQVSFKCLCAWEIVTLNSKEALL